MFLGLDHVTYNTNQLEEVKSTYLDAGWKVSLEQKALRNHPFKKPLLKHYQEKHHLALLQPTKAGEPWVELTQHGPACAATPTPIHLDSSIIWLSVVELEAEKTFWQHWLNLSPKGEATFFFKGPLDRYDFTLGFKASEDKSDYSLDAEGYTCLAFVVTNLEKDAQRLIKAGAKQITEPFDLNVSGQPLRLAFYQSPSRVFIELIQVVQEAT